MITKVVVSLILVALLVMASFEIKQLTDTFSAAILAAFCVSAFYVAMSKRPTKEGDYMEHHRHDDDDMEVARVGGFGMSAELRGRKLLSDNRIGRKMASQAMTNFMLVLLGVGLITHHILTDGTNKRILEELQVQNFLNTQTEAKRLEYGKRMRIPKALSDQLKPSEP